MPLTNYKLVVGLDIAFILVYSENYPITFSKEDA